MLLVLVVLVPAIAVGWLVFQVSGTKRLAMEKTYILAGGLDVDNVAKAIEAVRPYAVDVNSGVEKSPGQKDHELIKAFVSRVRQLEQ